MIPCTVCIDIASYFELFLPHWRNPAPFPFLSPPFPLPPTKKAQSSAKLRREEGNRSEGGGRGQHRICGLIHSGGGREGNRGSPVDLISKLYSGNTPLSRKKNAGYQKKRRKLRHEDTATMNVRTSDKKGHWLQKKKGQETSSRTAKLYSRRFFAAIPLEASSIWKSFF